MRPAVVAEAARKAKQEQDCKEPWRSGVGRHLCFISECRNRSRGKSQMSSCSAPARTAWLLLALACALREGARAGEPTGSTRHQPHAGAGAGGGGGADQQRAPPVPKFHSKIVFVGQLPYNATQWQVENFFQRKGLRDFRLRMLTDKSPDRVFRGIAFLEFSHAAEAAKALTLDRHFFGNRRIRVERTATGGGNSQKRKGRLKRSKEQQDQEKRRHIEGLLDRVFARRDARARDAANAGPDLQNDPSVHPSRRAAAPASAPCARDTSKLMQREDCDDMLVTYLCSLPERTASKAARACSRLEVSTVDSRGAFAMGMIKRKVRKAEKKAKKRLSRESKPTPSAPARPTPPRVVSGFYD